MAQRITEKYPHYTMLLIYDKLLDSYILQKWWNETIPKRSYFFG